MLFLAELSAVMRGKVAVTPEGEESFSTLDARSLVSIETSAHYFCKLGFSDVGSHPLPLVCKRLYAAMPAQHALLHTHLHLFDTRLAIGLRASSAHPAAHERMAASGTSAHVDRVMVLVCQKLHRTVHSLLACQSEMVLGMKEDILEDIRTAVGCLHGRQMISVTQLSAHLQMRTIKNTDRRQGVAKRNCSILTLNEGSVRLSNLATNTTSLLDAS